MFVQVPSLRHMHVVAFNTGDGLVNSTDRSGGYVRWFRRHKMLTERSILLGRLSLTSEYFFQLSSEPTHPLVRARVCVFVCVCVCGWGGGYNRLTVVVFDRCSY